MKKRKDSSKEPHSLWQKRSTRSRYQLRHWKHARSMLLFRSLLWRLLRRETTKATWSLGAAPHYFQSPLPPKDHAFLRGGAHHRWDFLACLFPFLLSACWGFCWHVFFCCFMTGLLWRIKKVIKGLFFGHTVRCKPCCRLLCCAGCLKGRIWDLSFSMLASLHTPFSAAASNFCWEWMKEGYGVGKVLEKFPLLLRWLSRL